MTRVKVCGITNLDDARAAIECGADAIGFVFAPSKRRVTPEQARAIVQQVPPFVTTVGVFMDETVEEVERIASYAGIDVIQLHGVEPPSYCAGLGRRVIKRIAVTDDTTAPSLHAIMEQYRVSAFLLDPGAGSGQAFDWSIALGVTLPVIVAGGLKPATVGQVVGMLHPCGVDVCSGVEKIPGLKDPDRVREFIKEVRKCS